MQGLDIVADRDRLDSELWQQLLDQVYLLNPVPEIVSSEDFVKQVNVFDDLLPQDLRLLLDVNRPMAQVVYVWHDTLHKARQVLIIELVVKAKLQFFSSEFLLPTGVESRVGLYAQHGLDLQTV